MLETTYLGAGLSIGLAGIGVAIGQGILAKNSMQVMGRNPKMSTFFLTITILGVALVESAAIYGLVVAFQILGQESMTMTSMIGAGLAIGLTSLGAGVGMGKLVSGALDAINANPEGKGKIMAFMILFIALIEVIAIYGLIISFRILGDDSIDGFVAMGAGFAIGFAGVGVAIGQGILAEKSMHVMGKTPHMSTFFLTITILGVALVESAAIYGLVVSFSILGAVELSAMAAVAAGLAIGLTSLGAGIGEGKLVGGALAAINRNPKNKGKIMAFMVLFLALIEVVAIYGLIVAFQILG